MARDDWFRNRSWTLEIEAEFERRLTRSRTPYHRGQYIYIQGYYLWEEARANPRKAAELLRASVTLLNRIIRDYPDHPRFSGAYRTRGNCAEMLGDARGALGDYRRGVERMRCYGGMRTDCWIEFASLAARQGSSKDHDEALSLLHEFADETLPFPVQRFKVHAATALIAFARGNAEEAKAAAELALATPERLSSDGVHHPTASKLGLVGDHHADVRDQLAALAGILH